MRAVQTADPETDAANPVVKGRDVITVKHERIISRYVFFDT